ncbi:MAG: tRNA (guanosine(46)-N7)-methyltransferase TrmB [Clostridia bacterium]|nr:tRNA (guanosine(46)-N7)-methyltransferase TrmB [Clostridia bacterium]
MRMRRKKNLEQRLAACTDVLVPIRYADRHFDAPVDEDLTLDLAALFGNDRPVHLEIGCGKGGFVAEAARRNPDVNFLAVEKTANVIVCGCETVQALGLPNVRFLKLSAEYLWRYLPPQSIARLYLNFSCPFPKEKYRNHRLTAPRFLRIYKQILLPGAQIWQKTDNMHFFEFSIENLTQNGFALQNVSLDLHNSGLADNIVTEYESRFAAQGAPIYRLEAYLP